MMKLAFATMLLVGLSAACSDDDDTPNDEPNGSSKEDSGSSPGSTGAKDSGSGEPSTGEDSATSEGGDLKETVECDPAGDGVCQNDTDCEKVEDGSIRGAARDCGISGTTEPAQCIADASDITVECAECYAELVTCSTSNCFNPCVTGPESEACTSCQIENGCFTEFDKCSGLSSLE